MHELESQLSTDSSLVMLNTLFTMNFLIWKVEIIIFV